MGNQKATRLKKKKGPGVDFKRVKTKVGKKLPKADNFTRTDFKTKALHLPDQSVATNKGATVTSRNLSLQELLSQTSHYNANSRKDSLVGLQELLHAHPPLLSLHTAAIIEKIAPRIADGDRAVRQALLALLSKTVMPGLPQASFSAFFPVLVAHVCNGLTHMAGEVRLSSVAFLDLLIAHYPQLINATQARSQIEDHYVTLLSMGGPFGGAPASLLKLVSSLHLFLEAARVPSGGASRERGDQSEGDTWRWGRPRASILHQNRSAVGPGNVEEWPGGNAHAARDGTPNGRGPVPSLSRRLVPRLLERWAECAPAALAIKPDPTTAQCLLNIARILRLLLEQDGISGQLSPGDLLLQVTQKVSPHFPVALPGVRVSARDVEDLVDLNLALCQLLLLSFGGVDRPQNPPPWEERLVEYLGGVLSGRVLPGSGQGLAKGLEKRALTEAQTGVVLACLEQVLRSGGQEERESLLGAFTGFYLGCGPQSRAKAAALRFMGGLLRDDSARRLVPPAIIQQWLASLPRLLWELRSTAPPTSHQVLLLLLHSARSSSPGSPLASTIATLQPSLLPFFCLTLPSKTRGAEPTRKFGPFAGLPEATQAVAVDLIPALGGLSPVLVSALAHCCGAPGVGVRIVLRLLQVLHQCATAAGTLSPAAYLSFLVTLLATWPSLAQPRDPDTATDSGSPLAQSARLGGEGQSSVDSLEPSPVSDSEIVLDAVCTGLARAGTGHVVLNLVGTVLAKLLERHADRGERAESRLDIVAVYSVLRAVSTCSEGLAAATSDGQEPSDVLSAVLPSALAEYWLEMTSLEEARTTGLGTGLGGGQRSEWFRRRSRPVVCLLLTQPRLAPPMLDHVGRYLDTLDDTSTGASGRLENGGAVLGCLSRLLELAQLQPLMVTCQAPIGRLVEALRRLAQAAGEVGDHRGLVLREELAKLETRTAVLFGQGTA